MNSFGPPQIYPPVPINIPGNQGTVTLVSGIPVFVPEDVAPALATDKEMPLNQPTNYSPPTNFGQNDANAVGPQLMGTNDAPEIIVDD
jgi:hypothetical protein